MNRNFWVVRKTSNVSVAYPAVSGRDELAYDLAEEHRTQGETEAPYESAESITQAPDTSSVPSYQGSLLRNRKIAALKSWFLGLGKAWTEQARDAAQLAREMGQSSNGKLDMTNSQGEVFVDPQKGTWVRAGVTEHPNSGVHQTFYRTNVAPNREVMVEEHPSEARHSVIEYKHGFYPNQVPAVRMTTASHQVAGSSHGMTPGQTGQFLSDRYGINHHWQNS